MMRAGRHTDQIFRYYVLKALGEIGLFDYLAEARTFGEIASHFQFEDLEYTHEVLEIITLDKNNLIVHDNGRYKRNESEPMPDIAQILDVTDSRVHQLSLIADAMYDSILERLRKEKVGVKDVFERNQKRVVNTFNQVLSGNIYSTVRQLCFDYLLPSERIWLQGKHLLEIGCGNGLETAELWLLSHGKTKITAVDTVPSMLELAEEQFESLLDDTFDAAFWLLMLHWTSDPAKAIAEAVRVVKPGGIIFGSQPGKPYVNPYLNLVIRSSRDSYGFFWKEDFYRWAADCDVELDLVPPVNIFRGRKPLQ